LQAAEHTILLVTHDVELVAACADRVVLLGDGEVIVDGPPAEIMNDSLIFSSQIGKLFRNRRWLTVNDVLRGLNIEHSPQEKTGSPLDDGCPVI
jgi:energy-coupling factor transport system ATP-binding protein